MKNDTGHSYVTAFNATKGLTELRSGRFDNALSFAQPAIDLRRGGGGMWKTVEASMITAMALYKLGKVDAAQVELTRGITLAEKSASDQKRNAFQKS
jgi:Flp pilus assembly protein TadD